MFTKGGTRRRVAIIGGLVVVAGVITLAVIAATGRLQRSAQAEPPPLSDVLAKTIDTRGIDAAVAQHRSLRAQGFPGLRESQADTNRLGYRLLARGDVASAIAVFELNVEAHPKGANTYDSLGEAYVVAGHTALAVEAYRKAVALDPHKKTALRALETLTGEKKPYRPLVLFHVLTGSLSILLGAVTIFLRKGSRPHALAGNVFFVVMLGMATSASYMALTEPHGAPINFVMGLFTIYLVATSWLTARRRTGGRGPIDWAALLLVLVVAAALAKFGVEAITSPTGKRFGAGPGLFFFFGALALLAAALDVRMIVRGGVDGAARIARHLWRMCAAWFIATTSLFIGQPQLFSYAVRRSGVLILPSVVIVSLLLFWLARVLFTRAYRRPAVLTAPAAE